jgi:hypothetical protein
LRITRTAPANGMTAARHLRRPTGAGPDDPGILSVRIQVDVLFATPGSIFQGKAAKPGRMHRGLKRLNSESDRFRAFGA